MRMKEMVRRTGVHERLLRYYEKQGLLSPQRLPSGYREYRETDVDTVRRVRCLLSAGAVDLGDRADPAVPAGRG